MVEAILASLIVMAGMICGAVCVLSIFTRSARVSWRATLVAGLLCLACLAGGLWLILG